MKPANAMAYSNLLQQARRKGLRYPEGDVEIAKHHYKKLKLMPIRDGHCNPAPRKQGRPSKAYRKDRI